MIRTRAFARAALVGNPSDGYYGKTLSFVMRNFCARVTLYESPRMRILPQASDRLEFQDVADLLQDVERHGYYGGVRLIKAAIKKLHGYLQAQGRSLPARNFTIEYDSDIPVRVGLAGSSAIVTATLRALLEFFGVEVEKPVLPNLILSVERDELGIGAGLQDRVAQVYEGAVFMDFARERMEKDGHGLYEPVPPAKLPPLFVAYHDRLAEGTEVTHNDLRSRWQRGETAVHEAMGRWAQLAQQARDLIQAGRAAEIRPLVDENFDLRASLIRISEGNRKLVEVGRRAGAAVNFAGSGGAVTGTWDGDPQRLEALRQGYAALGARLIQPEIA
jgi:glucuronokinase